MDFGLFVVNVEFNRLRQIAPEAEALGYNLMVFTDHFVQEGPEGAYDPHNLSYDPVVATAVVAEATKKMRVGHLVLCNLFRHPAVTARMLSSLDHLSGGRTIAGLGAGWTTTEFNMLGLALPEMSIRLRMLDEALTCIRSLWTREHTAFDGEFYRLTEAILWPKPVQKPHPPILVGGNGRGLLRVAAKHADIVNIILEVGKQGNIKAVNMAKTTGAAFKGKVAFVRDEARRLGRDPGSIRFSNSVFSVTLADSAKAAERSLAETARGLGMAPGELAHSPLFLIGTSEQCVAELKRRAAEWGVDHFTFAVADETQMRRLAKEVLARV